MKKTLLSAIGATLMLLGHSSLIYAADGSIDISGGGVAGTTCTINGGSSNLSPQLPPVSPSALAIAGSTAGRTPFQLQLTDCPTGGSVTTYFEPGPSVNFTTGRLTLDAGGATNVEVGLLNDTFGRIQLGAPFGSQGSQVVSIATPTVNFNYYAQYESLGQAGPGAANTRVEYSLIYQ